MDLKRAFTQMTQDMSLPFSGRRIALATKNDLPELAAIHHLSCPHMQVAQLLERLNEIADDPHTALLVLGDSGAIKGYIGIKTYENSCAEITQLYVRAKREGVGTRLVDSAMLMLQAAAIKRVTIESSAEGLDLYKQLGFDIVQKYCSATVRTYFARKRENNIPDSF